MSEIQYRFVKGQGWVPEQSTFVIHHPRGCIITIHKRPPKIGERAFWLELAEYLNPEKAEIGFYDNGQAGWTNTTYMTFNDDDLIVTLETHYPNG